MPHNRQATHRHHAPPPRSVSRRPAASRAAAEPSSPLVPPLLAQAFGEVLVHTIGRAYTSKATLHLQKGKARCAGGRRKRAHQASLVVARAWRLSPRRRSNSATRLARAACCLVALASSLYSSAAHSSPAQSLGLG